MTNRPCNSDSSGYPFAKSVGKSQGWEKIVADSATRAVGNAKARGLPKYSGIKK